MDLRYEPGDNKILHDEYFGKKPSVIYLLTVRLVLLCIMSCSYIVMFCRLYEYPGNTWVPAITAAGVSAFTYILASFFPAGIVYGTEFTGIALGIFLMRKQLLAQSGFFWDYFLLKVDSRLINTTGMFIHDGVKIREGYIPYVQAMNEAFSSAALLLAFIVPIFFTAAVRTRLHLSIPVLFAVIIISPVVMAETAGFIPSMIVFIICVFGFEAVYTSYELDSGFIFGSLTSAHMAQRSGDSLYRKQTRFSVIRKKIDTDTTRYHRYSSNLIAMSIVTAFVFFGAARLIPDGMGIKYEEVFGALEDFGYKIADTFGGIFGTTFGEAEDKGYFSEDDFDDISDTISIAPPNSSDRPVIEVTLSRNDIPVYLRGDIGVDYVNNSWTSINSIDDTYKNRVSEDFYPETEYKVFRLALAAQGLSPDDALPLQMVSTRYLRNTRVVFQPLTAYELTYRSNPEYIDLGDFVLRTKDSFVKSYECLSLTPTMTLPDFTGNSISGSAKGMKFVEIGYETSDSLIKNRSIPAADMDNEKYELEMYKYRRYINDTYMMNENPELYDIVNGLLAEAYNGSFSTVYDSEVFRKYKEIYGDYYENQNTFNYLCCVKLCEYFRDNFTYSLDTDNGEDQLKGFLTETHRGHCALFATAMTLALRDIAIPARYVTGYVAEGIGQKVPEGYRYTLTERKLHAWVEVYFTGVGWLPFDPTAAVPGYAEVVEGKWDGRGEFVTAGPEKTDKPPETSDSSPDHSKPPETTGSKDTASTSPTDTTDDTTSPGSDESGTNSGGSGSSKNDKPGFFELLLTRYLYIVIIVAVIIVTTIILIVFVNKLSNSEKRVLRSFHGLPPYEACSVMYRFILTLLKKKNLEPGNEQFYDFAERVDSTTLLKDTNVFMMDVMPVFEKCEFGNSAVSPVTDEEKEAVYRFTMALYKKIMSGFSPMKRFFVKISLFL